MPRVSFLFWFSYIFSCDNHYVIEAKTPETEGKMVIEYKGKKGHEAKGMFKDDREKDRKRVLEELSDSESDDDFKMPNNGADMMQIK